MHLAFLAFFQVSFYSSSLYTAQILHYHALMKNCKTTIFCFFLCILAIIAGCSLLPEETRYSESNKFSGLGKLLAERLISPASRVEIAADGFSLSIASNSVNQPVRLQIIKYPPYLEKFPWEDSFKPVSSLYQVTLSPEYGVLRWPASLTFTLSEPVTGDERILIARRNAAAEWHFLEPALISDRKVEIAAYEFSDWVPVKDKTDKTGDAVSIQISPTLLIARPEAFDPDFFSAELQFINASQQTESSRTLIISGDETFELDCSHPETGAKSSFRADQQNQLRINLFDSRFIMLTEAGNIATHSTNISLKKPVSGKLPTFLHFRAEMAFPSGIRYAATQNLRIEAESAQPTDTTTETETETATETQTETVTETQTETATETQTQTGTEFTITGALPAAGATNVAVSQSAEFYFSNPVNTGTLAFSFSPEPPAGLSTAWSDNDRTLTISPTDRLDYGQPYQITVFSQTSDIFGNQLPQNYVTSFTTLAATRPVVTSTVPVAGSLDVNPGQLLEINFSKAMQQTSVNNAITLTPAAAGSMSFSWYNNDQTLRISFSQPLAYATSYQLKIETTARDTEDQSLETAYLLSFLTISRPVVVTASSLPAPDSSNVPITTNITVPFSKTMNQTSAQTAFNLQKISDSSTVSGTFSWSDNSMIFDPDADLAFYENYLVSIAATAKDANEITLESEVTWVFKTEADEGRVWQAEPVQPGTVFSARKDHVMISFNNRLWVIGGQGETFMNDVWSSADGVSWRQDVTDGNTTYFAPRAGHACVVFDNKLWLTGGYSESVTDYTLFDDVWVSSDGISWELVTASADYYSRAWHSMAVFDNKLWVIAGETMNMEGTPVLLDECWSSSDGISWTLRSNIASFFPRKQARSAVLNGKLWIFGGYGTAGSLNDVWSTTNGDLWNYEAEHAAFPARCGFGLTSFNGRLWLAGGATHPGVFDAELYNDVWVSNNGLNWIEVVVNSPTGSDEQFSARAWHDLASTADKLYLSGGENRLQSFNEVWSTQ